MEIAIRSLNACRDNFAQLTTLLVDVVADGGSVSFMAPLAPDTARAFWEDALAAAREFAPLSQATTTGSSQR